MSDAAQPSDILTAAWLLWTGKTLSPKEHTVIQECVLLAMDHGSEPPSAQATRLVASCGKPLADAVAAGVLTFGPRHGNACSGAAKLLREAIQEEKSADALVQESLNRGERLSGFGHAIYDQDPRADKLVVLAKAHLSTTRHIEYALTIASALSTAKQKPLPLNIDGAIGAIIADLGVPDSVGDALFLWARTAGLVAQAMEASGLPSYLRKTTE